MAADVKYGSIVEFHFGDAACRAMVLANTGREVVTDEGTHALGDDDSILVLGLTKVYGEGAIEHDWHQPGETASLSVTAVAAYKVLA